MGVCSSTVGKGVAIVLLRGLLLSEGVMNRSYGYVVGTVRERER